jgi:hypothetical protein
MSVCHKLLEKIGSMARKRGQRTGQLVLLACTWIRWCGENRVRIGAGPDDRHAYVDKAWEIGKANRPSTKQSGCDLIRLQQVALARIQVLESHMELVLQKISVV